MADSVIATTVRFVSLLFGGLFAGFLITVLVIESTLRNSDSQVYTQVRHVELVHLDGLATATLVPTLIATAVLVLLAARMRGRVFWLTLTALVLLVTVLATSLVVNVPINHDQLTWNVQAPPTDWASVRDRWQIAHAIRTGAALLAFGCLAVAALGQVRSRNSRSPGRKCSGQAGAEWTDRAPVDSVRHSGGPA